MQHGAFVSFVFWVCVLEEGVADKLHKTASHTYHVSYLWVLDLWYSQAAWVTSHLFLLHQDPYLPVLVFIVLVDTSKGLKRTQDGINLGPSHRSLSSHHTISHVPKRNISRRLPGASRLSRLSFFFVLIAIVGVPYFCIILMPGIILTISKVYRTSS